MVWIEKINMFWASSFHNSCLSVTQQLPAELDKISTKLFILEAPGTYLLSRTYCNPYEARTPIWTYSFWHINWLEELYSNVKAKPYISCFFTQGIYSVLAALSPHTSPSTAGSGCCRRDERWKSGFQHAAQRMGLTSHRLSPWWPCPWRSGPQPPAGEYAQLPSMCVNMQKKQKTKQGYKNKIKRFVDWYRHKIRLHASYLLYGLKSMCLQLIWRSHTHICISLGNLKGHSSLRQLPLGEGSGVAQRAGRPPRE